VTPNRLTPARPSAWDLALLTKGLVRDALSLYGVSHAQVARGLGLESTARVDACLSDARDNQVPVWWLMHPGFPAQVRAHVIEEIARRASPEPTAAETPERQVMVALTRVGQFTTAAAATMLDAVISVDDAAQLLRVIDSAQCALGGLAARLRQRLDTGRSITVRGQS